MAASKKSLDINPVFNHRKSIALVDTAEDLVDSLDNLAVCLKHIDEKYVKENKVDEDDETSSKLYKKLRDNLETARDLTDTLKREKWRLSRREMSIELRMDELNEYKSHLKKDMTDMNQTVDILSMRVVQLENALCEAQELQEDTDAERREFSEQLAVERTNVKELEEKQAKLLGQIAALKEERKDKVLRQHSRELTDKMEILVLENKRLKEIIREHDEGESVTSDTCSETTADKLSRENSESRDVNDNTDMSVKGVTCGSDDNNRCNGNDLKTDLSEPTIAYV